MPHKSEHNCLVKKFQKKNDIDFTLQKWPNWTDDEIDVKKILRLLLPMEFFYVYVISCQIPYNLTILMGKAV